jgi:hypothetical protein
VEPALEQWDEVRALAGSYSLRVAKGIGRGSADLAINVRRPADVDIDVLAPTGAIEAYVRANDHEVGLAFLADRVVYRGPASGAGFAQALGFDLSAEHVVAAVLGYAIPDGERGSATAVWDGAELRVQVETDQGTRAWLHPVTQRFDRIVRAGGGATVTATLTSWLPDFPVPDALRLAVEPDGYRIELTLSGAPTWSPDFPPGFFEIDVPPGFEVRPLSELGQNGGIFGRLAVEE